MCATRNVHVRCFFAIFGVCGLKWVMCVANMYVHQEASYNVMCAILSNMCAPFHVILLRMRCASQIGNVRHAFVAFFSFFMTVLHSLYFKIIYQRVI